MKEALRILVADDQEDIRTVVTAFFQRAIPGSHVETAPDAETALAKARSARPVAPFHVILSDHQMGLMTGKQLLDQLAVEADPATRILMSANSDVEDQARTDPAIDVFIAKPFRPRDLARIIERAQSRRNID